MGINNKLILIKLFVNLPDWWTPRCNKWDPYWPTARTTKRLKPRQ